MYGCFFLPQQTDRCCCAICFTPYRSSLSNTVSHTHCRTFIRIERHRPWRNLTFQQGFSRNVLGFVLFFSFGLFFLLPFHFLFSLPFRHDSPRALRKLHFFFLQSALQRRVNLQDLCVCQHLSLSLQNSLKQYLPATRVSCLFSPQGNKIQAWPNLRNVFSS